MSEYLGVVMSLAQKDRTMAPRRTRVLAKKWLEGPDEVSRSYLLVAVSAAELEMLIAEFQANLWNYADRSWCLSFFNVDEHIVVFPDAVFRVSSVASASAWSPIREHANRLSIADADLAPATMSPTGTAQFFSAGERTGTVVDVLGVHLVAQPFTVADKTYSGIPIYLDDDPQSPENRMGAIAEANWGANGEPRIFVHLLFCRLSAIAQQGVIAHEEGHFVLGHEGDDQDGRGDAVRAGQVVVEEYQADAHAVSVLGTEAYLAAMQEVRAKLAAQFAHLPTIDLRLAEFDLRIALLREADGNPVGSEMLWHSRSERPPVRQSALG